MDDLEHQSFIAVSIYVYIKDQIMITGVMTSDRCQMELLFLYIEYIWQMEYGAAGHCGSASLLVCVVAVGYVNCRRLCTVLHPVVYFSSVLLFRLDLFLLLCFFLGYQDAERWRHKPLIYLLFTEPALTGSTNQGAV